jgi:CubicO group peptidase (beta-lactamase class C family)
MSTPRRTTRTAALTRRQALGMAGSLGAAFAINRPALTREQATPTPEGDVSRALDRLDDIVAGVIDRTGVPGVAVAVVSAEDTLTTRGYGVASTETGAPVDADTIFQLASVSKPIASTVIASIVGDGIVTWDTPIVDHLPDFALHDAYPTQEVSIRDMLCHRSGLPEHAGDLLEDMGYERDEVLHRLRHQPLASGFRAAYAYTNFGFTAGAVAASAATGQTWEDAAEERLYQRAGMTRTSSRFTFYADDINHAATHVEIDGAWVPRYVRDADAQSPAGGVSSTVTDLARWMRLQLGNGSLDGTEVVAADALAETHVPQIVSSEPGQPLGFYGLGWNVSPTPGNLRVSHSGAFALSAGTTVSLLLDRGIGIVVLTNGYPIGVAESITLAFLEAVQTGAAETDYLTLLQPIFADIAAPQYGTAVAGDPPVESNPPQALETYAGTWHNQFFGPVEIAIDGDDLTIRMGPTEDLDIYPLTHWDRDTFTYLPVGENANVRAAVTFTIGPDQRASRLWVENLDLHGLGSFVRSEDDET